MLYYANVVFFLKTKRHNLYIFKKNNGVSLPKRSGRAFAFMRSSLRSAHIGSKSPPFGGGREGLHAHIALFIAILTILSTKTSFSPKV
jgi:hypothetical protein